MAPNKTELKVLVGVVGTEKLRGLTSSLKKLTDTTKLTDKASKQLRNNIKSQFAESAKSINFLALSKFLAPFIILAEPIS